LPFELFAHCVCLARRADCRQEDPKKAIELFEQVVELESNKSAEVKW
jgi:hypothetical protein